MGRAQLLQGQVHAARLKDGTVLRAGQEVVTYVSRNLEPYRGFPQFYDALPEILDERPDCHVLIVGDDRVWRDVLGPIYDGLMTGRVN